MKTKKLLSLLLAITMVIGMMATLSINAFAIARPTTTLYVGEEFTITHFDDDILSAEAGNGHINPSTIALDESCSDYFELLDYSLVGENVTFKLKTLKPSDGDKVTPEVNFKRHDGEDWKDAGCNGGLYIIESKCYLDLTNNTKTIDQLYDVTVNDGGKTDVTKVQVSWTLNKISATVTKGQVWNPETLSWDEEDGAEVDVDENVTAEFNFKNLSSVKVNAEVKFEAATGITAAATYKDNEETTDGDGKIVLDTANTTEATYDNTGKVVVTVPADEDFFKKLTASATEQTYGTYTVTISKITAATVCSNAETASVYYDPLDTSYYYGTHMYADVDTVYEAQENCFTCIPCYYNYDKTTQKFGNSTSPKTHYATETEFEDVTVIGWYYFNGTKFVRCADDEVHPNDEELPTTNAAAVANLHSVTVWYYANANDEEATSITVLVSDGTQITVDESTIYIGYNSFTTAKTFDAWWVGPFQTPPATVTEDLEISPVTVGC